MVKITISSLWAIAILSAQTGLIVSAKHQAQVEDVLINAITMETGPVAAAEIGPWALGSGQQFVIVQLRVKNLGEHVSCAVFTPRLKVQTSEEYRAEDGIIGYHSTLGPFSAKQVIEGRYAFKVEGGNKPVSIVLERDIGAENTCRSRLFNPQGPVGSEVSWQAVELSVEGVSATGNVVADEQGRYSARVGNLLITPTAAEAASARVDGRRIVSAQHGEHYLTIYVRIKNVGTYPNCVRFHPVLRADFGYQIEPAYHSVLQERVEFLPPGEQVEGGYLFRVRDGANPRVLKLTPDFWGVDSCRAKFDPALPAVTAEVVHLPLDGLPSIAKKK